MANNDTSSSLEKMTYQDFDLDTFKDECSQMRNFRDNAYGENMSEIWKNLQKTYLPDTNLPLDVWGEYTFDEDGNATPDRLFARSDEDDDIISAKEPLVAIKVHTALSILTQRTPDVRWDSFSKVYEERARLLSTLRKHDWMDQQTRQQYVMMWFYLVLFGVTYWRRFYEKIERDVWLPSSVDLSTDDVEYEKQKLTEFAQVTAEALSPLQVWIDPATKPFQSRSTRKVLYEKNFHEQDFLREFEDTLSKEDRENILPGPKEGEEGKEKLIKVEYYENKDLDLYYVVANGREIIKDHLPWNHKELSVLSSIWMPRSDKSPFGLGPVEMMAEDKRIMDMFKSMTLTQTKFSIYKAVFHTGTIQGEGGESGDIRIRPDQVYKTSDPKSLTFFDMPGPGRDAWEAQQMLRERIDDSSGINRPLGGEIVKTTAFQTDLAKDAALSRMSVPINSVVQMLRKDAYLMFELQKQYYSLPEVKQLVDPEAVAEAYEELSRVELSGETPTFSLFVDQTEEGEQQVFRGDFRSIQLRIDESPTGQELPAVGNQEIVLTPEVFDWKGQIHVISDSLLTITPTVDRQRKLELFNLILPLFGQPPQLVAKSARELIKTYGEDPEKFLPEQWLSYLHGIEDGSIPAPQTPGSETELTPQQQQQAGVDSKGNLAFEQERASKTVTNIGGQKDLISSQSEDISP